MKNSFFATLAFFLAIAHVQAQAPTMEQLKAKYKAPLYTDKVLTAYYKTMEQLRMKPQLNEDIPGEVISWFVLNGPYSLYKAYLIQNNNIKEIKTIPSDTGFINHLNRFVPEQSKFSYSTDLWSFGIVRSKTANGAYLIKATVKSFSSYPEIPNDDILLYDLEYTTTDFKKFTLVRFKDIHTDVWKEVAGTSLK